MNSPFPFIHLLKVLSHWRSGWLFGPAKGDPKFCNLLQCHQLQVTQEMTFLHLVTVLSHASHLIATKILAEVTLIDTVLNLPQLGESSLL